MPDAPIKPRKGPTLYDNAGPIKEMSQQPGKLFASADNSAMTEIEKEQHRLYILLVMKMVQYFWNGNRKGPIGSYYDREKQLDRVTGLYNSGNPYLGHNIAAIAVDSNFKVTDFDFNHSQVFSSSIEHAEARLIRRLYSLSGLTTGDTVREHTVYTTLEPCAQCAGIMALAGVGKVVYVQQDEGTRRITDILYNLKPYSAQVKPITAKECGLDFQLEKAYENFQVKILGVPPPYSFDATGKFEPKEPFGPPFWTDPVTKDTDWTTSIAAFLCTDTAKAIYDGASSRFDELIISGKGKPHVDAAATFVKENLRPFNRGTAH